MSLFGGFWKKDSGNSRKDSSVGKWRVGDKITGRYEIYQILGGEGKSGMGILYVCIDQKIHTPCALKTFQDKEDLLSEENQRLFEREALIWAELGKHPNIVRAFWAEKLENRLFIILEYIAPNQSGQNSLVHYLGNLDFPDILKFSIQFCYGMEYAYSKGIDAHRDIKPDNIMITADKTVKITDFGLAKAFQEIQLRKDIISSGENRGLSVFQTKGGKRACGTLPYMAPEQFDGYADKRSDIYSFGITLYQMAADGKLPFVGRTQQEWESLHKFEKIPEIPSPLFSIVQKCLEKDPNKRYKNFAAIREEINKLVLQETGEIVTQPRGDEVSLEAWELNNKGLSFYSLGKYEEAIACYDKAMELDPGLGGAPTNKGNIFYSLGKYHEAITYYDKSIKADPGYSLAWNNKGGALSALNKYEEAIAYYDKAIDIDPEYAEAWDNKGLALANLRRYDDALKCIDEALRLNPSLPQTQKLKQSILEKLGMVSSVDEIKLESREYNTKGFDLYNLGKYEEAISYFDKAIALNPRDALAWVNKGTALGNLGKFQEAVKCYDKALEINPREALTWNNKGISLAKLGRYEETIFCFDKAIEMEPEYDEAWFNKAISLRKLHRHMELFRCIYHMVNINPKYFRKVFFKK